MRLTFNALETIVTFVNTYWTMEVETEFMKPIFLCRMEAKLKEEIEKLRKQLSEAVNKLEVQNESVGSMVQRIAELEEKDASRRKELEVRRGTDCPGAFCATVM